MKKIVNIRKAISGLAMTLALSMAMTGCSFGDRTNTNNSRNESSYEVQTDDIIDDVQEHDHEHEKESEIDQEIDNILDEIDRKQNVKDEAERKGIVTDDNKGTKTEGSAVVIDENAIYDEMGNLIIPDLSVQFNSKEYTKDSIIKALKLAGYNSSYEYRALLAAHFGIENYRGTAKQNLLLLDYLRHPEYFLGQDDISHNTDNTDNNSITDNNQSNNNHNHDQNNGNGSGTGNNGNGSGNGNGNGNGNGGNGGGSGSEDKEEEGKWILIGSRATSYAEIAGDDTYHYATYTDTYRNSKTGATRTTTRTVKEEHNYNNDSCKNCKHEKTKEQEQHNRTGSVSKSYKDNGDSGHTVTETQYCSTHNTYEVIATYSESHTPGEWKVNPDNPNEEIQVCTKGSCGHIVNRRPVQTAEHDRTGEIRKEYQEKDKDVHIVNQYQYCKTHGKEELVNSYEEGHHLGEWEQDPLDPTKEIQVCKDCGEVVNVRDKHQECDHKKTHESVTYEYVDANGHKQTITIICDDCKEVVGTPTTTTGTHTPTSSTKKVQKGTGDENGHYVVVTNNYDCCGEHVLDATYVVHGDEAYTEVGHSYQQVTQDGVDGHIKTTNYQYVDCEVSFSNVDVFTPCNNVDGKCECGREMSHSHQMHWEAITLTEEEAKIYCSKGANVCTIDGCDHREEPVYVRHGSTDGFKRVAFDDSYDQIVCVDCGQVIAKVEYDLPYSNSDLGIEFDVLSEEETNAFIDSYLSSSHSHQMRWEAIALTEEEAKIYCSKGANVCTIDGCDHREEPVFVSHGDNGYYRDYQDSGDWDYIKCATDGCDHVVDKVERSQVYDGSYGHFDANPKAVPPATEVDPWASFTISSTDISKALAEVEAEEELEKETTDSKKESDKEEIQEEGIQEEIVVDSVVEEESVEGKEIVEEVEKVVEKEDEKLYNEYKEAVDSYLNSIDSSKDNNLEGQTAEKAQGLSLN